MSRALGRYELLRPLARGGMAEVFLARRRAAGVEKWLVVKRMRPERAGDARFLDLFVREARLSMSLAHQNIVPVFDFGRIDDQVFLAMERVEGKDLGSSLAHAGTEHRLPPMLAAFIAAECCQALDYAHQRKSPDGSPLGIVHRDVTPRNVLLSWSGEVKLTDFGIAALAGDEPSKTIGTPAYMAPEQARADSIDPRADIYAMGLVLREALTGERARRGDDRETLLSAARKGELAPWPEGFDSPLKTIIDRATAIDRNDRYPDVRTMLEDIDTFIVGQRAAKKSDSPARQLAAWLSAVWKEEREETAIDEAIEGSHLVSFMDDGAIDILGTGTVRSMLATAGDEPVAVKVEPAPAPVVAPVTQKSRRTWIIASVLGVALVGGVAIARMQSTSDVPIAPPAAPKQDLISPKLPTNVAVQTPVQLPSAHQLVQPVQEPPPTPPANITPRHASMPHPHALPPVHPKDPPPAGPPPVLRKATIASKPWSYWTVDDDPARHQGLEQIMLAPGAHRIHFTGNEHFTVDRTVTIEISADSDFAQAWKLAE